MASEKTKKNEMNMEAVSWLLKPLKLESTSGYNNKAVAGGIGKWLPRLGEKLISQAGLSESQVKYLIEPLYEYDQAEIEKRRQLVKRVADEFRVLKTPDKQEKNNEADSKKERKDFAVEPIDDLTKSIQFLKGVGPWRSKLLKKLSINTIGDLIHYYPRDWQDRSLLKTISQVKAGESAMIAGVVRAKGSFNVKRGLNLTKIILEDQTGRIEATWFNQPYIKDRFEVGQYVFAYGKIEFFRSWQIANPEYEILDEKQDNQLHTGRLVPIYALTEKLSQRVLRQLIFAILKVLPTDYPEVLPRSLCEELKLITGRQAIVHIHFPETVKALEKAKERLIYEELILQQIAISRIRKHYQEGHSQALTITGPVLQSYLNSLPFELTDAQKQAEASILNDLKVTRPMHRLLQGDVGSGKTVLAIIAALAAVDSGAQAALMVPTEILAYQHYNVLKKMVEPLGINISLLTSSLKSKDRRDIAEQLAHGQIRIIVGTHALTQEKVIFDSLAVVIIDEQHRFGVEQRQLLRAKGDSPHVLVMTATPIPRTLALTAYGDLDVTTINELPPGRMPIKTVWLSRKKSSQAYQHIIKAVRDGRQAYIIFPLIDESEKMDLKALTSEYERLQKYVFKEIKMGLLHGRLKSNEKDEVMNEFKDGHIQVLASTTVVEVGVDVPNATIMVIEDADRFGLASLHQLRGRVGRGQFTSTCYVIADPKTDEGKKRMAIMEAVSNGFQLSEKDLALRGPGEFFGIRQHGLPDLKLANIIRDSDKIEKSQEIARKIIQNDEKLEKEEHKMLKRAYFNIYKDKEKNAQTG